MGLLNHFLGPEFVAKEIELDDEKILKIWGDYRQTIEEKGKIIKTLSSDFTLQEKLQPLKKLIETDLVDISGEEKLEDELIEDLESIEHSKKIKRINRLEDCLMYVETKYEHVNGLLSHIHDILKSELHLVKKLIESAKKPEKLISNLKNQFELEQEIIKKIGDIQTFHDLFLVLIKGEHIIHRMDSREKRLLNKMEKGINKIFTYEKKEGITHQWATTVFKAIEDKVHEGVAKGILEGYHREVDFEFTNRPEFIALVKEVIQDIRKREVSDQMINAFVHIFREWYNHGRD